MKRLIIILLAVACAYTVRAQQYLGLSGLIQIPSAEMDNAGDARIGGHYLNRHTLPEKPFRDSRPYNTGSLYLSLTPFSWIQGSYNIVLLKGNRGSYDPNAYGFYHKDEVISLKVRPLKEGRWWPAVAMGVTDAYSRATFYDTKAGNQYFANWYIAATKSFTFSGQTIAATLSYRRFIKVYNHRWNGVVGGVTYRPPFFRDARAIVEWTGSEVNFGIDCLLFRHLMIQASMLEGKYFSGGLCYIVNLF